MTLRDELVLANARGDAFSDGLAYQQRLTNFNMFEGFWNGFNDAARGYLGIDRGWLLTRYSMGGPGFDTAYVGAWLIGEQAYQTTLSVSG